MRGEEQITMYMNTHSITYIHMYCVYSYVHANLSMYVSCFTYTHTYIQSYLHTYVCIYMYVLYINAEVIGNVYIHTYTNAYPYMQAREHITWTYTHSVTCVVLTGDSHLPLEDRSTLHYQNTCTCPHSALQVCRTC